tara:strand:+ start:873 stop:1079 length:207 start_codon:yes stop_codon:yes gene_type:complete
MDIDKIIDIVRTLKEEGGPTMAMGNGQIAGSTEAGDHPPVKSNPAVKKKRKPTPIGRYRTRVTWMQNG